jgi:hypothetical protein
LIASRRRKSERVSKKLNFLQERRKLAEGRIEQLRALSVSETDRLQKPLRRVSPKSSLRACPKLAW